MWIRSILNPTRVSILVNGTPTSEFSPKRGLHQRDPLSPLLYIIVSEVLASMLKKAEETNILEGIKLPNCQDSITHSQFTDDTVLFIKNDTNSVMGV